MTAGGGLQGGFGRRKLLGGMAVAAGAVAVGRVLVSEDFAFAEATAGDGPYGPLGSANADGIQLPAGFSSRVVATTGVTVPNSTYAWHAEPDGGACFPKGGAGWVYASNSEVGAAGGGVGVIEFSPTGTVAGAYPILSGTTRNCAGGPTPWYTWLSCEENGAAGFVFECDPLQQGQGVARPALGRFNHEAAVVDPRTSKVYLTEDDPNGRLYRFTPTTPGNLSAGTLEVARVIGSTATWVTTSATGPDRQPNTTPFNGGEGAWVHGRSLFFTTKGNSRVYELGLDSQQLTILYNASTVPNAPLTGVDNVTAHPASGDLFVAEDGGNMEICSIAWVNAVRVVSPFLRFSGHSSSEVTGPAFSPDGTRFYFSSQRGSNGSTGVTYEVTGPFRTISPADPGSCPPVSTTTTTTTPTTTSTTSPTTSTTSTTSSTTTTTTTTEPTTTTTTTTEPTTTTSTTTTTTAPPTGTTLARDTFGRTTANGFGTAEIGGAWSLSGTAANFAVNGGVGRITVPTPGSARAASLNAVSARDIDARVDMSLGSLPVGGGGYYSLLVRRNGENSYGVRVLARPTSVQIQLVRTVNATVTVLAAQNVPGYVFASGDVMHVRLQAIGAGTTALRTSFWVNGQAVPTSWLLQVNDTTASLQGVGGVGVHGYVSSSSTGSVVFTVDNLTATPAP